MWVTGGLSELCELVSALSIATDLLSKVGKVIQWLHYLKLT